MADTPVIQPAELWVRHITRDDDSPHRLLDAGLVATADGVNGRHGWQTTSFEEAVNDSGQFELKLPNASGDDGTLHRNRFGAVAADDYFPGDEWIEIWRENDEQPLYTGTPVDSNLTLSEVTLTGQDARATEVLGKQRETAAGYLLGSPHDVISDLCGGWTVPAVQDFTSPDMEALAQSTGVQTTADGRFAYQRVDTVPRGARLAPGGSTAKVRTVATVQTGRHTKVWRAEATIERSSLTAAVTLVVDQAAGGATDKLTLAVATATTADAASGVSTESRTDLALNTTVALAIEGRGRWAFFYVDGLFVAALPIVHDGPVDRTVSIEATGSADSWLKSLFVRQRGEFITPAILDRRTPGLPPAIGLLGTYFDELAPPGGQPARNFDPTKEPYQRRVDAKVDFASVNPPAWQPPGSAGTTMSVRWTGSINLDLAVTDIRLRVTRDDSASIWVGDTHLGAEYLAGATTTGPWLRTLFGEISGWYPIVIEYTNLSGAGGIVLEAERSAASGTWVKPGAAAPAPALSPFGIYEHFGKSDSHAEQITEICNQTGIQTRLSPRSLESGEFPARMEIAPRVGRDTDHVLTSDDATGLGRQSNGADVASTLLCEATVADTSTPDQSDTIQITLEALAHETIGDHVLLHQDTESLSDLTERALIEQRARSLSALRASPNEEVTARPAGRRTLADTFPLTGELAEFRWRAGDGIRRDLPELAVVDASCVQLPRVAWTGTPGGLGAPNVSFRQRPRGLAKTLRQLARRLALAQRDHRP